MYGNKGCTPEYAAVPNEMKQVAGVFGKDVLREVSVDEILDSNCVEKGVSRVHDGGFAGTIQAFVKNEYVKDYKEFMNNVFREGVCNVYMIRKYGGVEIA